MNDASEPATVSPDDEPTPEATGGPAAAGPTTEGDAEPGSQVGLTGHAAVDDAVRSVLELGDLPVEEHVDVFEQAHSALRGSLNDAAAGRQGPPSPGGPRPTPPGPRPGPR